MKQELTEQQKELLAHAHSQIDQPRIGIVPVKLTMSAVKRKARNKRKAASKIPLTIVPLPGRAGNPKKNKRVRRERPQDYRNKLGVYIPFVLLNHEQFKTINSVNKAFLGGTKEQAKINDGLIKRAHRARRDGGYQNIEKQDRGTK